MSKFSTAKQFIGQIFGKQKTTGTEVINKVPPKISTKSSRIEIDSKKAKSKFKGTIDSVNRDIYKTGSALRRMGQKLDNKKITESGFNKAKDLAKGGRVGRMGGGMMGRRMGYSKGTPRKTNIQKIKEAFGPPKKKLSEKQMKIAKLAGDPKKIDAKDLAKLRGRG